MGVFHYELFEKGLMHPPPLMGNDVYQVAGVVLFNYAFSVTVPSWLNEKRSDVSVNQVCEYAPSLPPFPHYLSLSVSLSIAISLSVTQCLTTSLYLTPCLHHSINQTIWGASAVCSVVFVTFGLLAATVFERPGANVLVVLSSLKMHSLTRYSTSLISRWFI